RSRKSAVTPTSRRPRVSRVEPPIMSHRPRPDAQRRPSRESAGACCPKGRSGQSLGPLCIGVLVELSMHEEAVNVCVPQSSGAAGACGSVRYVLGPPTVEAARLPPGSARAMPTDFAPQQPCSMLLCAFINIVVRLIAPSGVEGRMEGSGGVGAQLEVVL